jgi:hypothetical protein
MNPAPASPGDVTKALEHRLRTARDEAWDDDRCHIEATGFLGEMRARGWVLNPDVDWRRLPPVSTAHPEVRASALEQIRSAIRAARSHYTNDPTQSETTTGEPDVQQ